MPCPLTKNEVFAIVLECIQTVENDNTINANTRFWDDKRIGAKARRAYFSPIQDRILAEGCQLDPTKIAIGDFEGFVAVKDVQKAAWSAII